VEVGWTRHPLKSLSDSHFNANAAPNIERLKSAWLMRKLKKMLDEEI
jgi:hypothetical protein